MQTQTDDIYKDAVGKKAEVESLKIKVKQALEQFEKEKQQNLQLNDKIAAMEKAHKEAVLKLHEAF